MSDSSTSFTQILGVFIPTATTAIIYLAIFAAIRNRYRKIYAPRTYFGSIPEKDRTFQSTSEGTSWFHDFRTLTDEFVLQHNSLDAYLYLRFLRFVIYAGFLGSCITWPILLPINYTGGGTSKQLDRFGFGNIANNNRLWAHLIVAWLLFGSLLAAIAHERLRLIGIRQAYLLDDVRSAKLSSRTVLFLNAPPEACEEENLEEYFGSEAERSWPVLDTGDLEELVAKRSGSAFALEGAEMDLIVAGVKRRKRGGASNARNTEEGQPLVSKADRPKKKKPPIFGSEFDPIERARNDIQELEETIEAHRSSSSGNVPERAAIFVAFSSQAAAHRAYQKIEFPPKMPLEDRFLAVQPKEVLWSNLAMPVTKRLSKASLALVFVIVFTIFFSIPVGLIGTLSNIKVLANRYEWLSWLDDLPDVLLGLLTGFVPPYLTSAFVSYVPKLFRHIAKLSGEPTVSQAELKTQAWFFVFQVLQVFLVTTFSSGAAAVASMIAENPEDTPMILAEKLPTSSNFYLTYFILQGTASAASTVLNYSDLFEFLFYVNFWDKTPRQHYSTYSSMKGTPWASWYPKFTNFLVIAVAYACIAPLVLGFAAIGLFIYYVAYRYQLLYVCSTKTDTKGESYKRALQQMPTGIYIAQLCLIGLFSARKAALQTTLMVVLLVITAIINFIMDRALRPLELYLGVDAWQEQESEIAQEDGIDENDTAAVHAATHGRRLGLNKLPGDGPKLFSDLFDSIVSKAREETDSWLRNSAAREEDTPPMKEEELKKAYLSPAMTSKTPKLWIPKDSLGISKQEIEQNQSEGITTTDEAAEIDEDGKLQWDHRFENVPIFSMPKTI